MPPMNPAGFAMVDTDMHTTKRPSSRSSLTDGQQHTLREEVARAHVYAESETSRERQATTHNEEHDPATIATTH